MVAKYRRLKERLNLLEKEILNNDKRQENLLEMERKIKKDLQIFKIDKDNTG
jgi:hypothetical protein